MNQDLQIKNAVKKSFILTDWVASCLNGLTIEGLRNNKRLQMAMGCQHLAIEHSQAIITLVDNELHGSALALQRPLFEAVVRGVWLRYTATSHEVDEAAKGMFPDFQTMTSNSPKSTNQSHDPPLQVLKQRWWSRLCSYTHGGPEQFLARLDHTGVRASYPNGQVLEAMRWSDIGQLFAGIQMAAAAKNEPLTQLFMAREEWG